MSGKLLSGDHMHTYILMQAPTRNPEYPGEIIFIDKDRRLLDHRVTNYQSLGYTIVGEVSSHITAYQLKLGICSDVKLECDKKTAALLTIHHQIQEIL